MKVQFRTSTSSQRPHTKHFEAHAGAMIMATEKGLAKDADLGMKIDKAIIPGLQGGPHMNTIAGIGVALKEASTPEFQTYAKNVVANAKTLATALTSRGFTLVSGGTDNHLLLLDFSSTGVGRGKLFHLALERIGLYANMNTVPNDQSSALWPSGLRLGSPGATTRGMGAQEMEKIADWISRVADHLKETQVPTEKEARSAVMKDFSASLQADPFYTTLREEVRELCRKFPIPSANL
jgi:glycine hydroxymethyltransferase